MEEQIERRRFPRISPELSTQLSVEEGWPEEAECIDLSGGGALVRGPRPGALGATVELYLRQLGEGRPLRIRAEVVRHVTSPSGTEDGYLMALRFEALDGTTRLELEELMGIASPPQIAAERRRNSRHEARFLVEVEHPDARFRGIEDAFVLIRASHLALLAARAFAGVNNQRLEHYFSP